jgi:lipopolysaccharide transport system ATP-binding protein
MTTAIRVEGLSKSYVIRHQQPAQHAELREALTAGVKKLVRSFRAPFAPRDRDATKEVFWALRDVNLDIREGERIGIIGRNGAGKSTLLKLLTRITEPTLGRIEVRGRVCSLLEVGTGFHPELTGRENIYLNGAILGMTAAETRRKFDEIVAFAEVERFLDTPVKRYSSGMYVRLAFAVAAHLEPDILIVDEVLAVGDAAFQRKSLTRMEDVTVRGGRTVVFVSHNMLAIQSLCERAFLLDEGRVVDEGAAGSVVASYMRRSGEQSYTALVERSDRLGDGRMRFVSVVLRDESGHPVHALRTGDSGVISIALDRGGAAALRRAVIAIGIDGQFGERITVLSSEATGERFETFPDEATSVDIHIPRLPLMPGRYGFTLYATVDGTVADWVQSAGFFDVEPGDFYRSGKLMPAGQGHFLVDCKFVPTAHPREIRRN